MKKFKVTASYTTYLETYVEAEDLEQAEQLACELDGGEFTHFQVLAVEDGDQAVDLRRVVGRAADGAR